MRLRRYPHSLELRKRLLYFSTLLLLCAAVGVIAGLGAAVFHYLLALTKHLSWMEWPGSSAWARRRDGHLSHANPDALALQDYARGASRHGRIGEWHLRLLDSPGGRGARPMPPSMPTISAKAESVRACRSSKQSHLPSRWARADPRGEEGPIVVNRRRPRIGAGRLAGPFHTAAAHHHDCWHGRWNRGHLPCSPGRRPVCRGGSLREHGHGDRRCRARYPLVYRRLQHFWAHFSAGGPCSRHLTSAFARRSSSAPTSSLLLWSLWGGRTYPGFYGLRDCSKSLPYLRGSLKPAVGGLVVGIIGFFVPQALSTGFGVLQGAFRGDGGATQPRLHRYCGGQGHHHLVHRGLGGKRWCVRPGCRHRRRPGGAVGLVFHNWKPWPGSGLRGIADGWHGRILLRGGPRAHLDRY